MMRLVLVFLLFLPVSSHAQETCRPAPDALVSYNACAGGDRLSLALVGDVLLHRALQWRGYARGFSTIWGAAAPLFHGADMAIANFEGPVAPGIAQNGRQVADPGPVLDERVYSGYPRFNYHPVAARELAEAGIDLVTTANNHALDRGVAGVAATMDTLDAIGLPFTGTIRAGAPRDFARRFRTRLGVLAFIGCSYDTNGIRDPHRQVLLCFRDRDELLALVRAEVSRPGVAGVVVLPHWGQEYSHSPDARQRALARDLVAAGALMVVGAHPHVVQPIEAIEGPRGRALVAYSTGNFVAAQVSLPRATGIALWADLCRAPQGGVVVAGAGVVPTQMMFGRDPVLRVPATDAGRALIARLIPGHDLSESLRCSRSRALTDPQRDER